jgi:hypothetical protein
MNDLRRAMAIVDEDVETVGLAAVSAALVVQGPDEDAIRRKLDDEAREKAEAEAQRQRDLDGAMGDVVELVARHRARLGRKTCSAHDGATIRKIFDLLRSLHSGNGDE